MIYSKELREWASLIQSNVHATEALRKRDTQQGAGSTIRALMVEVSTNTPAQGLGTHGGPTKSITEKLWDDIDKSTSKMRNTLPVIIGVNHETLPDISIDSNDTDDSIL